MSRHWWWAATAALALLTPGPRAQEPTGHAERVMQKLERAMELLEQEELGQENRAELKHLVASLRRELLDQQKKQRDLAERNLERVFDSLDGRLGKEKAKARQIEDLARNIRAARDRARAQAGREEHPDEAPTEAHRKHLEQAHEHYQRALEEHLKHQDGAKHAETVQKAMEFLKRQQAEVHDQAEQMRVLVEEARRQVEHGQQEHADLMRHLLEGAKQAQEHGNHAEALRALLGAHEAEKATGLIGELLRNPDAAEHLRDMALRIHEGDGALADLLKQRRVADEFRDVLKHREQDGHSADERPDPVPAQQDLERMMKELRQELREVRAMVEKIRARAREDNGGAR